MADRSFTGIWIPKEIWLNSALNILDKAIVVEIGSLDRDERGCYASNRHFADMFGCTERQVSASVSKLVKMGYVKVLRFDGRNRYLRSTVKVTVGENGEADVNNPSSSITEPSEQPDENFQAASPKLPHSNSFSNSLRDSDRYKDDDEKSACACEEVNPYGGDRIGDTVQKYALDNLRTMTPGHMQEFNEFMTVHEVSEELMKYAVDVACGNGAPVWNYVAQVLYGWLDAGVKSVGDAKAEQAKRKKKRDGPTQSRGAIDRDHNRVPLPYGGGIIV